MRIENEIKLDFDDVLIKPKRSTLKSRKDVSLYRTFKFRNSMNEYFGIPIIAANMDGVGTYWMAHALNNKSLSTALIKHYSVEDIVRILKEIPSSMISIGSSENEIEKLKSVYKSICKELPNRNLNVRMDVANGYTETFVDSVKKVRELFPNFNIFAGNVVSGEMTEELILSGADVVVVGIGQGSVCSTRIKAGVGVPQLSAVIECADAAHGLNGHIVSDGGCKTPGDVAKAFAAGADFVMLGGMLAGHSEGDGEIITRYFITNELIDGNPKIEQKQFVKFYGMSSKEAMEKNYGFKADYRSSEGRVVEIPYKPSITETIDDILGGVRSTCSYVGATELRHLSKCTTFVRVNNTHNKEFLKYEI
jgi:GMP reductase